MKKKSKDREEWIKLPCGLSVKVESSWIGSTGSAPPLAASPEKG